MCLAGKVTVMVCKGVTGEHWPVVTAAEAAAADARRVKVDEQLEAIMEEFSAVCSQLVRNRQSKYSALCKNGNVVYGQEPPSGESTTAECGFNYQLLAVMY